MNRLCLKISLFLTKKILSAILYVLLFFYFVFFVPFQYPDSLSDFLFLENPIVFRLLFYWIFFTFDSHYLYIVIILFSQLDSFTTSTFIYFLSVVLVLLSSLSNSIFVATRQIIHLPHDCITSSREYSFVNVIQCLYVLH